MHWKRSISISPGGKIPFAGWGIIFSAAGGRHLSLSNYNIEVTSEDEYVFTTLGTKECCAWSDGVRSSTKRNVSQVSGSADSGNTHVTSYVDHQNRVRQHEAKTCPTCTAWNTYMELEYPQRPQRGEAPTEHLFVLGALTLPTDSTSASSSLHCVIIHRLLCFGLQRI